MKRVMRVLVSKWDHVCGGNGLWEEAAYMGTARDSDSQLASKSALNDFTEMCVDSSLLQNCSDRML